MRRGTKGTNGSLRDRETLDELSGKIGAALGQIVPPTNRWSVVTVLAELDTLNADERRIVGLKLISDVDKPDAEMVLAAYFDCNRESPAIEKLFQSLAGGEEAAAS